MIPKIKELRDAIGAFAERYASTPMVARTHGQPAVPTTFGKEFHVFRARINGQLRKIEELAAVADFDSVAAETLDAIRGLNTIVLDFVQDVWRYISDDWIVQKVVAGEVGSSTMPQKVNPIMFENSEGNAGISSAFLAASSTALLLWGNTSNLIRGNINEGLAHAVISYDAAMKGLGRISINEQKVREVLDSHAEMLAEPIQIILRRAGVPDAYGLLKTATRGRKMTMGDVEAFIDGLEGVSDGVKAELRALRTATYTGMAEGLVGVE